MSTDQAMLSGTELAVRSAEKSVAPGQSGRAVRGTTPARGRKALLDGVLSWGAPVLLLGAWELLARVGVIGTVILPAPSVVFATAKSLLISGELQVKLLASLQRAVLGFAIGASSGLLLGIAVGFSRLLDAPYLLLLDEPFAALDALTRINMLVLVRALVARHRPAVLLVTHDVDEAIALADRVLVMRSGRIDSEHRIADDSVRDRAGMRFGELRETLLAELGVVRA